MTVWIWAFACVVTLLVLILVGKDRETTALNRRLGAIRYLEACAITPSGEYTRHRAKNGNWPEPREVPKELGLVSSKRDEVRKARVDTYRNGPSGPSLVFFLSDDGGFYYKIDETSSGR